MPVNSFAVEAGRVWPAAPSKPTAIPLRLAVEVRPHPRFERPLGSRRPPSAAPLLNSPPWVRSLGKLAWR